MLTLHPWVVRVCWLSTLLLAGLSSVACGPDDTTGGVVPFCVLDSKTSDVATVRCGDELAVDVWRSPREDVGCYVASGERSANPVIRCGEFDVTLNEECVFGFAGDVAFGDVPGGMGMLSATAFSLSQCTDIQGDLIIDGYDGTPLGTTLEMWAQPRVIQRVMSATRQAERPALSAALRRLESVNGDMLVARIEELDALDFPSLVRVSGELRIENTRAARAINMPELRVIGQGLWIDKNLTTQTIDLAGLERVGGTVRVSENNGLTSFELPSLNSLGGAIRVRDNCALRELGFPVLERVKQYVHVHDNAVLVSARFDVLREVFERVGFSGMPLFDDLGLPMLVRAGDFTLDSLDKLAKVSLPALERVDGGVTLRGLTGVQSLSLVALAHIEGELYVAESFGTAALEFGGLETLGSLRVRRTFGLETLAFPVLESINAEVVLHGNEDLRTVASEGETVFDVGGDVTVMGNPQLLGLGFHRLETLGGGMTVQNNPSLQELDVNAHHVEGAVQIINNGIEFLVFTRIEQGRSFEIEGNSYLQLLSFPFLATVEESISIRDNAQLSGGNVPVIWSVGGFLDVRNNPALPSELAYQICNLIAAKKGCIIQGNGP